VDFIESLIPPYLPGHLLDIRLRIREECSKLLAFTICALISAASSFNPGVQLPSISSKGINGGKPPAFNTAFVKATLVLKKNSIFFNILNIYFKLIILKTNLDITVIIKDINNNKNNSFMGEK
jgi:hypothetical protein